MEIGLHKIPPFLIIKSKHFAYNLYIINKYNVNKLELHYPHFHQRNKTKN